MNKNINIGYIGVVKEYHGEYKLEQVPIIESVELKRQLRAMCKNPNRTLLDLQDTLAMGVKTDKRAYNCCLPYPYSISFIDYVRYPQEISFDDYQAEIKLFTDEVRNNISIPDSKKDLEIEKRIKAYERQKKDAFMKVAIRYIEAMDFDITRTHIKVQGSTKMMSHEFIGWTILEYKINEDLTITVHTNFGYGSSSYFFVNVCYKSIDLLPYAATINYYYANMQDIIKCTRNYSPERERWQNALDFVTNLGNDTKKGIDDFAYNWIRNEITEMMDGLRYIKCEPKCALDNILNNNLSDVSTLVSVRDMTEGEVNIYKTYPEELTLIFKVEKISNALALLAKLKEASIIYEDAISAIEEIKELNITIAPEIQEAIERLNNEITALKEQKLTPVELELSEIDDLPIRKRVNEVYEWLQKRTSISRDRLDNLYAKKQPEYAAIIGEINKLKERRSKIKTEINDRRRFMERLQKCYTNIADAGLLAA